MKIVGYIRVSTAKQGQSGLGLDAQRAAVQAYAAQHGAEILEMVTEIESGKKNDRPELLRALHLAKVTGATLVIAKLDRLSRSAAFLTALQESGVQFVAADMPHADSFTVGILAMVARKEREAISMRTREALQAAKARGRKLGNPNGAAALLRAAKGNTAGVQAAQQAADQHAEALRPVVEALRAQGVTSLGTLAEALNGRGMRTPRGATWHKSSVRNLLDRLTVLCRAQAACHVR